ncbi:MAG: DUF128 domain-containing protein, partial [Methanomicrobiales archaeon]|nr:DUF128 domain-containing protein [Methanomicrobiales archaeon]
MRHNPRRETCGSSLRFINSRIEDLSMEVTWNPAGNTGKIVYNLSLVPTEKLEAGISLFRNAYRAGLSVSDRVRFFDEGTTLEGLTIPPGFT